MKIRLPLLALALVATGLPAGAADAPKIDFPSSSPACTYKQRVGLTDVEISYSRPSMKDRKVFGALVPYGEVWRTGANQATKISFSTAVKLDGTALPAGSYELFSIPGESEWTIIFQKPASQWGAYRYDAKNDVVRLTAKPVALPNAVETFAIGLADLRDDSATLYLGWERTRINLKLTVDLVSALVPQIEAVMASDAEKKPYFQSAMFYLDHDLDAKKALAWFDAAIAGQENPFYMVYHKARLLAKTGDKAGALAAANQSIALAAKYGGSVAEEYTRLNQTLIASLK